MPSVRDPRGPCHVNPAPDIDPGQGGPLPTIATSDKRYIVVCTSGPVKASPLVAGEGSDGTRARVDGDDAARVDADDDARAFWRVYGSEWGRAARAAGAALAIVGTSVWSPSSPPRVLARRMRILARVLYIGGGAA